MGRVGGSFFFFFFLQYKVTNILLFFFFHQILLNLQEGGNKIYTWKIGKDEFNIEI